MDVAVKLLTSSDAGVLFRSLPGVFDHTVDPQLALEFLEDPRHSIAIAIDGKTVVGFASGVRYVHPDKAQEFWVNEVAVAEEYRRRGIGRRLVDALLSAAREAGCIEAWVLTSRSNGPAMRLYAAAGGEEAEEDQVMFTFRLRQ